MSQTVLYIAYHPGDPKHRHKFDGIRRFAKTRGWDVAGISHADFSPTRIRAQLAVLRPVGCVVDASDGDGVPSPALFGETPVVYLDPSTPKAVRGASAVVVNDDDAIARAAFRELSIGLPPAYAAVSFRMPRQWARERIAVFRDLCAESGRPCIVFAERRGEDGPARASRLAAWVAGLPAHCAVFGVNDYTAGEALLALRACGRPVPGDVTLVGVDGTEPFAESPASDTVSSVQIDFERAGYLAARLLARRIDARRAPSCPGKGAAPEVESFGPLLVLRRASTRGRGRLSPAIANAVEIIRREATSGLTARALAARIPGSRKHFERRFREAMGHSVLDEILHARLEHVQSLLARNSTPIGAIAALSGFGSDIELKRLFRRRTGMSMLEWRRRHVE